MLNELEEFRAYTEAPSYFAAGKRDNTYLGRFTLDTLLRFEGLGRILTVLARGYMWQTEEPNIRWARNALLAWCSLPDSKKTSPPEDWQYRTNYAELHGDFPELVDESGKGWFYRHVLGICSFVKTHPELVAKPAQAKFAALDKQFAEIWRKKLNQLQTPLFHEKTKGAWVLRFDDVLAEAKEQGPLRDNTVPLSQEVLDRLKTLTPKGVPETVLPTLVQYYLAHRQEDTDWVVLPAVSFDAYFGVTSFTHCWLYKLPEEIVFRDPTRTNPCRYRIKLENLPL